MEIEAVQVRPGPDDDRGEFTRRQPAIAQHVPRKGGHLGRSGQDVADMAHPGAPVSALISVQAPGIFKGNDSLAEEQKRQHRVAVRRVGDARVVQAGDEIPDAVFALLLGAQRKAPAAVDALIRHVVAMPAPGRRPDRS